MLTSAKVLTNSPGRRAFRRVRGSRRHWRRLFLGVLLASMGRNVTLAQPTERFLSRTSPSLPFPPPEPAKYNLKIGRLKALLHASTQFELNDNVSLLQHGDRDVSIGPQIGIGFLWPISDVNILNMDLSGGYRWYLNHPSLSTLNVSPNSHLDYRMWIKNVALNFHDNFAIEVDPTSRPELSGGNGNNLVNYRRVVNTSGVNASWQPARKWSMIAGYDFSLDRSISGQYTSLDHYGHNWSAGVYHVLSSRWTLGMTAAYSITDYIERIQNNGWSWSVGPIATFKPTKFLTFDASVSLTSQHFDHTGTINDTSEFEGVSYQAGVRHILNSRSTQYIRARRSITPGFASNFTDILALQYGYSTKLTSAITLNTSLSYETFTTSGPVGESADRYLFYIGTHFQLTRRVLAGLGYTFSWKDSNQPGLDYQQNRLTLDLAYQF
ncbi:MAG TPA: outer membrane beta-barrel protein [Verrucomicrobiae bacterium]|nr:outer membrane beta-barrel protein [Verrucomicrobiae bacterium]